MEGNLSRARSTIRMSPSPSPSLSRWSGRQSPLGPHQPVGGLYRSISRTDRKFSPLRLRPMNSASLDKGNNSGHSRVQSESFFSRYSSAEPSRSVSAMGGDTTSYGINDRYASPRPYLWEWDAGSKTSPLREDLSEEESIHYDKPKILSAEDFNAVHPSPGLKRSQSQIHVRDLQDQMKGLRIKVSSLKVKTQADNLRRDSLQSSRRAVSNPLSLTTDPWYAAVTEVGTSPLAPYSSSSDVISEYARENSRADDDMGKPSTTIPKQPDSSTEDGLSRRDEFEVPGAFHDDEDVSVMPSISEDVEEGEIGEGEEDDDDSDEVASRGTDAQIQDYDPFDDRFEDGVESSSPTTLPDRPESRPHEEREDAFDYEHFILQSALGNYSRSRPRSPSEASSTTSSTATTRPLYDQSSTAADREIERSRAGSVASVSTVATFATANEGDEEDDDSDDDDVAHSYDTPRGLGIQQRGRAPFIIEPTTTSLASSLVSTVKAASGSEHDHRGGGTSGINKGDTRLLEELVHSLGQVCMELQTITMEPVHDKKRTRVLRRRLDAGRRVLDGELDV